MVKVETAEWVKTNWIHRGGKPCSESTSTIKSMKVGDCLRIEHNDISCDFGTSGKTGCSLNQVIHRLRGQGWELEAYHEKQYVLVIRRLN